jgi:hypothetical protein
MVVLRYEIVQSVLNTMDVVAQNPALSRAPDAVLYEALRICGVKVYHHLPSLADDIGHGASTIGNEHTPDTAGFRFHEWTTTP